VIAGFGRRARRDARLEQRHVIGREAAIAEAVQDTDEGLVFLAEDALQGGEAELRGLEAWRLEEPRAAIAFLQDVFDFTLNHGRQLVEIARENHADAAERGAIGAVETQRVVDGLHHVGADHGDLVDHHGLDGFHHPLVADLAGIARIQQPRRKIEEAMDRLAADIDGREPGGGEHDGFIKRVEDQLAQQRRLARSGAAGEEDVAAASHDLLDQWLVDVGGGLGRQGAEPRPNCRPSRRH